MESGTLRRVPLAPRIPVQRRSDDDRRTADVPVRATADQSTPDEPMAVLLVGCHDSGKRALTRALLRGAPAVVPVPPAVVPVPPATYLVMRYGPGAEPLAHVPGCRQPRPYRPGPCGEPDASLARPPRRVEVCLPDPLLRHFALVESPCAPLLGSAGGAVLADAAERGGAVVFAVPGNAPLTRSELDLLAELGDRDVSVFFAVMPPAESADNPAEAVLAAHRAAVARHAPRLVDSPWIGVDPAAGDTAFLRRALVEWAGAEGLRRASVNPPVLPAAGTVHIGDEAAQSGWSAALDRWLRNSTRVVRQRLAIEVANIHLRCVQDLVFGAGCAGLPGMLDNELHALSQRATAESDTVVASIVHEVLQRVLAAEPTEDVRRRVVTAVRRALAEDPDADLARVLLVTSTGGVAVIAGREALVAMPGYAAETAAPILPPVGLAVSGGCYVLWHSPAKLDVAKARSWLQRVTRAVELELLREVGRRFDAVHRSLGALIGETVDHGILLA